jgi:hypothetical protein
VQINKAWRYQETFRIDLLRALAVDFPNGGNESVVDSQITVYCFSTHAVYNVTTSNNNIVCHDQALRIFE